MEINKQLFEDVLSGKLKGTFVLRNSHTYDSKYFLKRTENTSLNHNNDYPYALISNEIMCSYTENGKHLINEYESALDIVNFIPDTI